MKSIKILILIAIGAISFYSCSNSSSDILSKGELFLKESLDDPSSYQRISIEIIDTVRLDKFTKDIMYKVYDMNEIVSYELAASRVEFSKKELDSLVKYKRHTSTIKDFKESVIKKNRNSLDSLLSSVDSVYYIVSKEMLEKKSKELPGIESMFLKIEDLKRNPAKNKIQYIGIQYTFRSKNKMGALTKQTAIVEYNSDGWINDKNKSKYYFHIKNIDHPEIVRHVENIIPKYSLAQFYQIKEGMNYKDVTNILNEDGEVISSNELAGMKTVMMQWKNNNFSNMNAIFQNGRLITKAQFGLK